MDTLCIFIAGFSTVAAALLLFTYLWLLELPNKAIYSVLACVVLSAALACIQIYHLLYFMGGAEPLTVPHYRIALFVAPTSFYFFGRWVLLPTEPIKPLMLLHLVPVALLFVARLEIALPILFLFGTGYSVWLWNLVHGLEARRRQLRFQWFFFALMAVLAVAVLILGFSIPYIDPDWFYYFYCNAIALAFAIVIAALIAKPDLMQDMMEAARVRYGASTLRELDVEACLAKLESLMTVSKLYQNENLSLSSLARALGISSHQLSELVNARLGVGFSRYIRERRVAAAKELLVSAPSQSILSISMDTGFKSQSSFYAAFKEVVGQSPGDYRKGHAK